MAKRQTTASLNELAEIGFSPIGVPVDPIRERDRWLGVFGTILLARKACEMEKAQVVSTVAKMVDADMAPADILEPFELGIGFLEGALAMLRDAQVRMCVGMASVCETA